MKLYAERNEVTHTDINELARTKQWLKLADRIAEDLAALETEKLLTDEQRAATKSAIWYKIGLHFEIFVLDEESFTVSAMKAWPLDDKGKAVRTSVRPAPTPRVEPMDSEEEGSAGTLQMDDEFGTDNLLQACVSFDNEHSELTEWKSPKR
ncbi:hypothetical protein B0T16DRAFT_452451 [Cercophora newfieldiana]|uniref:Uncharacterized protein n=1 Tax=Cercophora newfieldiana TaxID=92897 RepID=A0AA39YQS7_9PEZI|nr:hypothetical protein B0T16DRAFT_452451 [Cercophora newfieldiana]